jgi:hypothetical protein
MARVQRPEDIAAPYIVMKATQAKADVRNCSALYCVFVCRSRTAAGTARVRHRGLHCALPWRTWGQTTGCAWFLVQAVIAFDNKITDFVFRDWKNWGQTTGCV